MSCRVREDAPTPLSVTSVEERGAPLQGVLLGSVQILDRQVKVELLRVGGVLPLRRPVILHALKGQYEPTVGVKCRPVVAQRPSLIRLVHYATDKRLVEPGQLEDIRAVQDHTLQLGSHERQRLMTSDRIHSWNISGDDQQKSRDQPARNAARASAVSFGASICG